MAEPARTHSSLLEQIQSLLDTRILVLDGAYGSLLQELKLGEDDYRGSVFPDHELPLAGNHDVLCLTQPEIVADAPEYRALFGSGTQGALALYRHDHDHHHDHDHSKEHVH